MTDQIKIIQDISLLFELSLSVGSTLDPKVNCHRFLRTLISRKSLSFGAIWLYKNGNGPESACDLFYLHPHFRQETDSIVCSPFLVQALQNNPYFSISSKEPHFDDLIHENKVTHGSYAVFGLGELGFLKIFATNRPDGFTEIELAQLKQVVDKLKISLEAGFAHLQLKQETESKLSAQKEVEQARMHMETLISNLQSGILLEDKEGRIVLANKAFCSQFEIPVDPQLLVGMHGNDAVEHCKHLFFNPAEFIDSRTQISKRKTLVTKEVFQLTTGLILERDYIPLLSADGYEGHLWQFRDITQQQTTEQAIRESEEKYRGVLENMELGLLEVDDQETILRVNNAFCQMVGYTLEDLVGLKTLDLFLPEASKKVIATQLKERKLGRSSVYELQFKRKDGALIWLLISGAPVRNSSGQTIGSLGIHFDLTERKNLETALEEAKLIADRARLAERQFLTHMSHEIRTPINAVIGMTHLLDETEPNQTQKEYLNSLRFSADSLLAIVDNILDLSKIDAGEIEFEYLPFDLSYLVKSLLQTFQFKVKEKALHILESLDPDIDTLVTGDPSRINQILTNLLGNALKFTEKGVISLSIKVLEKTASHYHLEFRVHDTGIGIPADKTATIFEYFKQANVEINRKFGGTGLGLTIVKQLVEMQGGTIHVESELGVGSDFVVRLSFGNTRIPVNSLKEMPDMEAPEQHNSIHGLHFLIVEDNLLNQKLLCKTIQIWKGTYAVANNGQEALEKSSREHFDIILMDIHMPVLDGFETTLAIRSDEKNPNRSVPILALTAAALSVDKRRAFEAGMNGFLTKPIAPKVLKEHILNSVQKRSQPPVAYVLEPEPSFDLSYLMNLSDGDQAFVQDILDAFLSDTPQILLQLEMHAKNQDWEHCYKLVHKLKPNFAMLGMKKLEKQAALLETQLKNKTIAPDQLALQLAQLQLRATETLPLLEQLKAQLKP